MPDLAVSISVLTRVISLPTFTHSFLSLYLAGTHCYALCVEVSGLLLDLDSARGHGLGISFSQGVALGALSVLLTRHYDLPIPLISFSFIWLLRIFIH